MSQRFTWGWMQVLVAFLIQSIGAGALMYAYSIVAVPLDEAFQPTRLQLMLGMTFMMLGSGFISPWLGATIDRKPLRKLLVLAIAATAIGFLLLSFVTAISQVHIIYGLLMSFGVAMLGPLAASTLVSRWFMRRRGLALGIAAMGTSFGGFLFPLLIQWVTDAMEWRTAFRLLALSIGLMAVPVWFLTVDRPQLKGLHPDGKPLLATADSEMPKGAFDRAGLILKNRSFWAIAAIVGIMFGAYTGVLGNLAPFAIDTGISAARAAGLVGNIALMAIPGTLIFGWLADHIDVRACLGLVVASIALGILCFLDKPPYALLVTGSLLIGLGGGGMIPIWSTLLANVFGPWSYGRVMGLMNPMLMIFNLIAAPLAGHIQDTSGSYHWAFVLFATLMLASLLLLPVIEKKTVSDA